MASEKLLPCPFERGTCGRNALSIQTTPDPKGRTGVRAGWVCCHDCGTRGPLAYADEADIQEVAAYNWNDRVSLSQGQDGAVGVIKPLKWEGDNARTEFGYFTLYESARDWYATFSGRLVTGLEAPTREALLPLVHAWFETRIRSTLASHLAVTQAPAQEAGAEPSKQAVEAVAEVFYDSFVYGLSGEKPKWVEGGNSLVQDEARRYAHRALRALAQEGQT